MAMNTVFWVGQAAYLLTFVSFLFRNITWLRAMAILSSALAVGYCLRAAGEPLWIPLAWNAAFIVVNIAQLGLQRWRSRAVRLDPLEDFLGKTVLHCFPPAEVKSFAAVAKEGNLPAGHQFIEAGQDLKHLFCIVKGEVDVVVKGEKCAELSPGFFVGEMSLLTKARARANVVAKSDIRLLVWPHEEIEKWVDSDAQRLTILQQALGSQVVNQLLRQNDALLEELRERE